MKESVIRVQSHTSPIQDWSRRIKSNFHKWLVDNFSTGLRKSAKKNVQIIEKWQGNGRTCHDVINLGEAAFKRNK